MPGAQDRFSSICPVSYSDYCSAPWQYQGSVCCGICPSPAIASYGTVAGLIVGSFFNMLIVLFQPDESAAFIGGQLTIAHMYLIAVFIRNIMGSASEGTNGMQKWHAEFAFLLGASSTGVVLPAVLSDTHHIHCDEMVGGGLIQGVSVTFVSLSFLFTLLLIIPVFFPTGRYKSAAHFIVLLLSHRVAEARVRISLSVFVWSLWFVSVMIVLFSALDNFLLVGTSTSAAWPYAAIQNFMFGFFPLAKFFLKPSIRGEDS
ncbi:hypothetical protein B0A53_04511 [Rhodotorula sp. CCFEE 5036]|nr:hypothetical protein B0A53_04511 [Rhodotorula sp. CCFEE 5036]